MWECAYGTLSTRDGAGNSSFDLDEPKSDSSCDYKHSQNMYVPKHLLPPTVVTANNHVVPILSGETFRFNCNNALEHWSSVSLPLLPSGPSSCVSLQEGPPTKGDKIKGSALESRLEIDRMTPLKVAKNGPPWRSCNC